MWQSRRLSTLWASTASYRNSFTLLRNAGYNSLQLPSWEQNFLLAWLQFWTYFTCAFGFMRLPSFFSVYFTFLGRKLCNDISLSVKSFYYYYSPLAEHVHIIASKNVFLWLSSFRFIALPVESSNGETKTDEDKEKINKRIPNRDEPSPAQPQLNALVTTVIDISNYYLVQYVLQISNYYKVHNVMDERLAFLIRRLEIFTHYMGFLNAWNEYLKYTMTASFCAFSNSSLKIVRNYIRDIIKNAPLNNPRFNK
jgi:hypothetical protein